MGLRKATSLTPGLRPKPQLVPLNTKPAPDSSIEDSKKDPALKMIRPMWPDFSCLFLRRFLFAHPPPLGIQPFSPEMAPPFAGNHASTPARRSDSRFRALVTSLQQAIFNFGRLVLGPLLVPHR